MGTRGDDDFKETASSRHRTDVLMHEREKEHEVGWVWRWGGHRRS